MDCPETETLAAIIADEPFEQEVAEHIRGCPGCKQRIVNLVEQLDIAAAHDAFLTAMDDKFDEEQGERIWQKVSKDLPLASPKPRSPDAERHSVGVRWVVAACLVAAFLGGLAFWMWGPREQDGPEGFPVAYQEDSSLEIRFRQTSNGNPNREIPRNDKGAYEVARSYEVVLGDTDAGFMAVVDLQGVNRVIPGPGRTLAIENLDVDQEGRRFFGPFDAPAAARSMILFLFEKADSTETLREFAASYEGDAGQPFIEAALNKLKADTNDFVRYRRIDMAPAPSAAPQSSLDPIPDHERELRERGIESLQAQIQAARDRGDTHTALERAREMYELQRDVLGEGDPQWVSTFRILADLNGELDELDQAQHWLDRARQLVESGAADLPASEIRELELVAGDLEKLVELTEDDRAIVQQARGMLRRRSMRSGRELAESLAAVEAVLGRTSRDFLTGLRCRSDLRWNQGNFPGAEEDLKVAVEIGDQLGEPQDQDRRSLVWLYADWADYAESDSQFEMALDARRRELTLREILQPPDHWQIAGVRSQVARLEQTCALGKEKLDDLQDARSLIGEAQKLVADNAAAFPEAIEKVMRCAALIEAAVGQHHEHYAGSLFYLGWYRTQNREYEAAEADLLRALELLRALLGPRHPDVGSYLDRLGTLRELQLRYEEAESLLLEAYEIANDAADSDPIGTPTEVRGARDGVAIAAANLGRFYYRLGRYADAEPLMRQAAKTLESGDPVKFAGALVNLGSLFLEMGDLDAAQKLLKKSTQIMKTAPGDHRLDYALSLNSLGLAQETAGQNEAAKATLETAFPLVEELLPGSVSQYATVANSLAITYLKLGESDAAETLLRTALDHLAQNEVGRTLPARAVLLRHLASVTSDPEEAKQCAQQALEVLRQSLGEGHHLFLTARCLEAVEGDGEAAREALLNAVSRFRHDVEQFSAVQSDREQLLIALNYRESIDTLLTHSERLGCTVAETYNQALAWKGMGLTRARARTFGQYLEDPELRPLAKKLQSVASTLTRLSYASQTGSDERIVELREVKESLERELRRRDPNLTRLDVGTDRADEKLSAALPADAVLLDYYEFEQHVERERGQPLDEGQHLLTVFVLRAGHPVRRVDLGESGRIEQAVEDWRRACAHDTSVSSEQLTQLGGRLHELLWQPVEEHLSGVSTVLISPDGPTARVPFGVIPSKDGTYLLERFQFASIPTPQILPDLLADSAEPAASSLLAVGDVDYGASSDDAAVGSVARIRSGLRDLDRLPGTGLEITGILESFRNGGLQGTASSLRGVLASESAFKREAPGQRFIHAATHGFFAPAEVTSTFSSNANSIDWKLANQGALRAHPDLLSGIAFAGARRAAMQGPVAQAEDDGVLTAMEVATLDLRTCELVVLSACETGLGQVAGGEGVLGLQRAFHIAGADTTLASLWVVDTQVTRQLMQKFYRNLWELKMTKIEALRAAQLEILKEPDADTSNPYYWGGWILSGDPF